MTNRFMADGGEIIGVSVEELTHRAVLVAELGVDTWDEAIVLLIKLGREAQISYS